MSGMNVHAAALPGSDEPRSSGGSVGMMRRRPCVMLCVLPPQAAGSEMGRSTGCRRTSPTRSPPARSSSGRRRSSRSWSRTPSTPARGASPSRRARRQEAGPRRGRWRGDGRRRTRGWRIERHATSKIRRADDLARDRDARLPRRGAAVDRVGVAFRAADARARHASGTEIRVNGGVVASVDGGRRARRHARSRSTTCSTTCRRAGSS